MVCKEMTCFDVYSINLNKEEISHQEQIEFSNTDYTVHISTVLNYTVICVLTLPLTIKAIKVASCQIVSSSSFLCAFISSIVHFAQQKYNTEETRSHTIVLRIKRTQIVNPLQCQTNQVQIQIYDYLFHINQTKFYVQYVEIC